MLSCWCHPKSRPRPVPSLGDRVRSVVKGKGWPADPNTLPNHFDRADVDFRVIDRRRPIDIVIDEPAPLKPAVLKEHRATRTHLMERCLKLRGELGLPTIPGVRALMLLTPPKPPKLFTCAKK